MITFELSIEKLLRASSLHIIIYLDPPKFPLYYLSIYIPIVILPIIPPSQVSNYDIPSFKDRKTC